MIDWNAWAIPALAAMGVAVAMAMLVYLARPWREQNRWLAAAIALGGLSAGLYFGVRLVMVRAADAWLSTAFGITALILSPLPYLFFLSTLRTPLVAPLRRPRVRLLLLVVVLGLEAFWLAQPRLVLAGVERFRFMDGWNVVPGPWVFPVALLPLLLAELFGFVVAISAYRRARTPIERTAAGAYAVAFGTRDLLGASFIVAFGALHLFTTPVGEALFSVGIALIDGLFFVTLGYAILQHQLFDIHVRIKWTIRQSTIGAAFAGVFFLASEGVEQLLAVNGTLAGVAAAAAVTLLLRPLRKMATRVANAAMPAVSDTPEYLDGRRAEVYRAAVESGWSDGNLTQKERMMLDRLRSELGIPEEEAERVERAVKVLLGAEEPGGVAANLAADVARAQRRRDGR